MTFAACALASLLALPAAEPTPNPFAFKDGDRVVFLGSTLIEREQKYGYWELALTLLNKDKNVTFRNLGWSGDTVWCESRGMFDDPKKGFERTMELVKELKPTVIVLCYGQVESFDGEAGVKKFTEGYEKLIDALMVTKARIVLMTPTRFEDQQPIDDETVRNASLSLYVEQVMQLSAAKKLEKVRLFERHAIRFSEVEKLSPTTDNGIHLTESGYIGYMDSVSGFDTTDLIKSNKESVRGLRAAIVAKNELFFHRWRPQNQTYLLGFRKKEQGQNAKEIVEFDPLIEKAEKEIADLRKKIK